MTLTNTGSHLMTAAFYNEMRKLETEDVRDDDTLHLVSVVEATPASTPRATAAQAFTAALHGDEGGQVGSLAEPLLALTLWQERMEEV